MPICFANLDNDGGSECGLLRRPMTVFIEDVTCPECLKRCEANQITATHISTEATPS